MSDATNHPGIVCPFWAAASNPANQESDPDAPEAIVPGRANGVGLIFRHLRHHAGFSVPGSALTALLGLVATRGLARTVRNLWTLSFDPQQLAGGFLDRGEGATGILRGHRPDGTPDAGAFHEENFLRMFGEYGADFVVEGRTVRGLGLEEIKTYIRANQAERNGSRISGIAAKVELIDLVFALFAIATDDGTRVVTQESMRLFYHDRVFPQRR